MKLPFRRPAWPSLKLNRLDLYIARQFLTTFFFMVGIVVIIIVVIDVAEKIDKFTEKQVPIGIILREHYLNYVLTLVNLLSPIVIFLAVIFFTSQLAQRSEIVAILSSGVSFYRFLAPYLVAGGLLALLAFYLNGYVVPRAVRGFTAFDYQYLKSQDVFSARHIHKKISPDTYIYFYNYNQFEQTGYVVSLEQTRDGRTVRRLTATQAKYSDSTGTWRLSEVRTRYLGPTAERLAYAPTLDTVFQLKPDDIFRRDNSERMYTITELAREVQLEEMRGSEYAEALRSERYMRYSYPFATLILTVMGVALSSKKSRGGIGPQLGLGLVLSFVYVLLLQISKLALTGLVPSWAAVWLPNLLFLGLAVFLIRIAPK